MPSSHIPSRAISVVHLVVAGVLLVAAMRLRAVSGASVELRAALNGAALLLGVLAVAPLVSRFTRTHSVGDLAVAVATGLLAMGSCAFGLFVPIVVHEESRLAEAGFLAVAVLCGVLMAIAGVGGARRVGRGAVPAGVVAAGAPVVAVLLAGRVWAGVGGASPVALAHVGRAGIVACYGVGLTALARRAVERRDSTLGCLAIAAGILAIAWLMDVTAEPHALARSGACDLTRLAALNCLFAAALLELGQRHAATLLSAVERERCELARRLHDGIAQDLAFIALYAKAAVGSPGGDPLARIAAVADRALLESRGQLRSLTHRDVTMVDALRSVASQAAAYGDAEVRVVAGDRENAKAPIAVIEAAVGIVREAVTNALKHAGTDVVEVRVERDAGWRVIVTDDGHGFDLDARSCAGFGLTSMRERAAALGGSLWIDSRPGSGTRVIATLP